MAIAFVLNENKEQAQSALTLFFPSYREQIAHAFELLTQAFVLLGFLSTAYGRVRAGGVFTPRWCVGPNKSVHGGN